MWCVRVGRKCEGNCRVWKGEFWIMERKRKGCEEIIRMYEYSKLNDNIIESPGFLQQITVHVNHSLAPD
jgi:hypothetical protein